MSRALLVLAVVALLGCGGATQPDAGGETSSSDGALVDDTTDSANASVQSSALARPLFLALDSRALGADVGADAASQLAGARATVEAAYTPQGCAALSTDAPGHLRLAFADCATAGGLEHLSGELLAVLSGEPGRVHLELSAPNGLFAASKTIDYAASADIVTGDGTQTISWKTATWRAVTAHGSVVSHRADYAIVLEVASRCSVTSGSTAGQVEATDSQGLVETRGLTTVIDGLAVCPGRCPTSGTIRSTGDRTHRTVVLRFDGGPSVHVTGAHGAMFDLALPCGV